MVLGSLAGSQIAPLAGAKAPAEAKKSSKGPAKNEAAKAGKEVPKNAKAKDKSKDAKTKEVNSKDLKGKDAKAKDLKSKDAKAKDLKSKDAKAKDTANSKSGNGNSTGTVLASVGNVAIPNFTPTFAATPMDILAVRQALTLARQGKTTQATEEQQSINDPAARKLIEWAILRADNNGVEFSRYLSFLSANPTWP